ncbi:MAG: diacylglycerol kinase family protein [Lactobacillus sp.]|jgi:undecaprenol kinase|nr:diacylglycerol kinase family protein [Lactobacillus sp.]
MALKDKPQTKKNHHFFQSLKHAGSGVLFAIRHERNLRRDLIVAAVVFLAAYLLKLPSTSFLWLGLVIFLVFQAELWNSVAEYLVDLSTKRKFNPLAKVIKDLSAGIVLLTALFSVVVGLIIFLPAVRQVLQTQLGW